MDKFKEGLKEYPSFPSGLIQRIIDNTSESDKEDAVKWDNFNLMTLFHFAKAKEGGYFWIRIWQDDLTPYYELERLIVDEATYKETLLCRARRMQPAYPTS